MEPNRILIASYGVPSEDRDSGARRLFDFVVFCRENHWQVDFVAANGFGDTRYVHRLQQLGVGVHDDSPQTAQAGEISVTQHIERLAKAKKFPLALIAFWPVAELYLPILRRVSPPTRVIVDSVDLHFLREARRDFTQESVNDGPALLDDEFAARMTAELNVYAASDMVLTVSQKESDWLNDFGGDAIRAEVVPDCEDMDPSPIPLSKRRGVLFLGSFQHLPNVDALKFLCQQVLPRVDARLLARHPVYIVGNGVNDEIRQLAATTPGAQLVGWVPSVVPYFHRENIGYSFALRRGTKRKMIQALMTQTPTVSTSIGTEGLRLCDDEHVLVADDPVAFAMGIERLLQEDDTWEGIANSGREHILKMHGRANVRNQFRQVFAVAAQLTPKEGMLPESSREQYYRRLETRPSRKAADVPGGRHYQRLVQDVQQLIFSHVPADATLAIISKGDEQLVSPFNGRGWHFPMNEGGEYAGFYPADGRSAIADLKAVQHKGADYLVVPSTAAWWLRSYPELGDHLSTHCEIVAAQQDIATVYKLNSNGRTGSSVQTSRIFAHGAENGDRPVADGVKLIAFYLPQFHPIPENDRWWGKGFTEWQNVTKARPLFEGHYQPHLPADLGYYDLRLPEVREQQAALARHYGIHGFCYYHYWFHGKRLLERPFNEVLESGSPDFPFCLCWANEPWSRRWDGSETDVLQAQSYSAEDDLNHIRWLLGPLSDRRAITVAGKPIFLVYRADQLPDAARTTDLWRREAERMGLNGLYLLAVETGWDAGWDATQVGFDAKVLFQPQFSLLATAKRLTVSNPHLRVYDYPETWPILANPDPVPYLRYDTVFPMWDNTARKGDHGWVIHNSTATAYGEWLQLAIRRAHDRVVDQHIVFINAWNEWAEGTHLEPDQRHGSAFLETTARALRQAASKSTTHWNTVTPGR